MYNLSLCKRINWTLVIIWLCVLYCILDRDREKEKNEWIAISIGHKCSSKNNQQIFQQFAQCHVLVTLFTASPRQKPQFYWMNFKQFIFDLYFSLFFFLSFRLQNISYDFVVAPAIAMRRIDFISGIRQFAIFWKVFDCFNFHFVTDPKINGFSFVLDQLNANKWIKSTFCSIIIWKKAFNILSQRISNNVYFSTQDCHSIAQHSTVQQNR